MKIFHFTLLARIILRQFSDHLKKSVHFFLCADIMLQTEGQQPCSLSLHVPTSIMPASGLEDLQASVLRVVSASSAQIKSWNSIVKKGIAYMQHVKLLQGNMP